MSTDKEFFAQMDNEMLVRMVMDGFRRTVIHYGAWFAEVAHQVGLEKAMAVEDAVWQASVGNQVDRLGKTLDFPVDPVNCPASMRRPSARVCRPCSKTR